MGYRPFFPSVDDDDELVRACIELALIYNCDPYVFLNKHEDEVLRLYKISQQVAADNNARS